jgi:branched-chain amino acid transport system substrate-binding protein
MFKHSTSIFCAQFIAVLSLLYAGPVSAQIRVGQTTGLTGPAATAVKEINIGAKLYLDAVNAEGGINGQKIELVSLDDKSDVPLAIENANKLISDPKVVALFLSRGTPQSLALLPVLASGRVPLIAPSSGAMALHTPVNPWVFNVRANYRREAEAVTRHLGLAGLEKVVVLYQKDSFGEDAVEGALKVFKEAGKKPGIAQSLDRDKPDYAALMPQLVDLKPMAVIIIASPSSVITGVKAMRAAGLTATIATLSNNASSGFSTALGAAGKGVIVSQVFPSERRLALPLIASAARLADAKKVPELTPAMIEGFSAARVLVAGLRRAEKESKVITGASLKRALESFQRVDIGGLEISFSPTNHTGLEFADLSIIGEGGAFRR